MADNTAGNRLIGQNYRTPDLEPPVGAGLCAVSDAVGDGVFRRAPVTPDVILTALEARKPMMDPLTAHI